MLHVARRIAILTTLVTVGACATVRGGNTVASNFPNLGSAAGTSGFVGDAPNAPNAVSSGRAESACGDCEAIPMPTDIARAVESRIVDLKSRGGDCSRYGTVLESSYRSGQITVRPYMWRVGSHLASGEAKPNGEMMLAREIDSLNVGVRTVSDVLWTMEHEAAHIAFDLMPGIEASEEKANQTVRACKS
jgi:hypothetical protein